MPVITAVRRLSQVDHHELDTSLGNILSSQAGLIGRTNKTWGGVIEDKRNIEHP